MLLWIWLMLIPARGAPKLSAIRLVAERQVAGYEDPALQVEDEGVALGQELEDHLRVAGRRPDNVLFGAVVEDELESEGSGRPALLFGPGRLVICDLSNLYGRLCLLLLLI